MKIENNILVAFVTIIFIICLTIANVNDEKPYDPVFDKIKICMGYSDAKASSCMDAVSYLYKKVED